MALRPISYIEVNVTALLDDKVRCVRSEMSSGTLVVAAVVAW